MSEYSLVNSRQHFAWLDTIRFVAAFIVVLCHSRNDFFCRFYELPIDQQGLFSMLFYTVGRMGNEAVFTFFVLSGFLVGGRGFERMMNQSFNCLNYVIDRGVRIMLPLVASIILYIGVAYVIGVQFSWFNVLGNLLSLQCVICDPLVSPFWSLSYEVWFYIWLLSFAGIMRKKIWGFVLFVICCFVYARMNAAYLLIWLMGAAAYLCRPKQRNIIVLVLGFIIVLIGCALCQMTTETKFADGIQLDIDGFVFRVLLCVGICVLAQQVVLFPPKNSILIKVERVFSKLADFSYTLYLTHRIVLLFIFTMFLSMYEGDMSMSSLGLYILVFGSCMLVAFLMYLIAEKHTKRVKCWLKDVLLNRIPKN